MAETEKVKLPGNGNTAMRVEQREQDTTIIDGVAITGATTFYATKARAEELQASELAVSIVGDDDDGATVADGEGAQEPDTASTTEET